MVEYAVFDMYHILVELTFGSIAASFFAIAAVFAVMGFMLRMSPYLLMAVLLTFTGVFWIGFVGALAAIPIFLGAFIYFGYSVINFVRRFT